MAVRNQKTNLYEARKVIRATGQEFLGTGNSKDEANADLKKQLEVLDIDYKKDVEAAAALKKEGIKNFAQARRDDRKEFDAAAIEACKDLDHLQKEMARIDFMSKDRFLKIDETEAADLKKVDAQLRKELVELRKNVTNGKLPKRIPPLEPTGETFHSSGFAFMRDSEGRPSYGYAPDQQRNVTARPDLAKMLQKDLADAKSTVNPGDVTNE